MLRASTLTFIFLFLLQLAHAEKYNVIHVKGSIKVESSGTNLKPGMAIDSDEKIVFGSRDAMAALFSPAKGRFTLSPGSKAETIGSEFFAYVKQSLVPGKSALSTRAGETLKNIVDIKAYFGAGPILILGTTDVKISETAFPMNDETFFFLRYNYNGEAINKKLPYEGNKLFLNMEDILKIEEIPISKDEISGMTLHYYNAADQTVRELTTVEDLNGMNKKEFVRTVKELVDSLDKEKKDKEEIQEEVEGFLTEFFGRPDKVQLADWLGSEF